MILINNKNQDLHHWRKFSIIIYNSAHVDHLFVNSTRTLPYHSHKLLFIHWKTYTSFLVLHVQRRIFFSHRKQLKQICQVAWNNRKTLEVKQKPVHLFIYNAVSEEAHLK